MQKKYSLKPGPPKKDPKVKGVSSSAVQAFLKKQELEQRKKGWLVKSLIFLHFHDDDGLIFLLQPFNALHYLCLDFQKKKQKEELLAKRVELKSDRKARAMASRTKDNFHGYNGIPIVDQPKKRQSKAANFSEQPENDDACYDEDNYEYADSDSDSEPEPMPVSRPQERSNGSTKMSNMQQRTSAPPKAAPPPLNFADLLKLAEKKQFEPVELKPIKKTEERLRTAEEIRELELERKAKKQDKGRDVKPDKSSGHKDGKSSMKKNTVDRDIISHRPSSERSSSGISKMPKLHTQTERLHSSAKSSHGSKPSSSSSGALSGKAAMKGNSASVKQTGPRPQSGQKPTTSSDLNSKKDYPGLPHIKTSSSGSRTDAASNSSRLSGPGQAIKGSGHTRPSQGNINKKGPPQKLGKGEVPRTGASLLPRPGINGPMRSVPAGPSIRAESQQPRPRGGMQGRPVPAGAKPSANGQGKLSRPLNSMGQGPGRPPCTVVSETISSKNFAPKQGMAARPPVAQGPKTIIGPTGHRVLARPSGKKKFNSFGFLIWNVFVLLFLQYNLSSLWFSGE